MVKIADQVNSFDAVYPRSLAAASTLHAQAGFSDQQGVTPGVRIKRWRRARCKSLRPHSPQLSHANSGVPTSSQLSQIAERNPDAVVDVVKAAFSIDDKYLSFYSSEGDPGPHHRLPS